MKLKHYYKKYASQLREANRDIEDVTCKTLVSKIMNCLGTNYPVRKVPSSDMSTLDIAKLLSGQKPPVSYLPYIMQNLRVAPNDYLKFYFLDTLTNQLYIDALINMVCHCYKRGIQFIFDFSSYNFTDQGPSPSLYVEYQVFNGTEYVISSIVYHCPFNGDMEMEDFRSILLDTLYILNPEKCLQYLTLKLAAGVTTIPYSQGKEITIIPCNGGDYSPLVPYRGIACNYREGQVMENFGLSNPPVFTLIDGTKAVFQHDQKFQMDVSQIIGMLG